MATPWMEARVLAESLFRCGRKPLAVLKALKRAHLPGSRSSVFDWASRFRGTGTLRGRKRGSGRSRVITGTLRSGLLRSSRGSRFSARRWAQEHHQSRETVRRTLQDGGKVARVRRRTPMLTAVNKLKRLEFAKHYSERSTRWWRRVTFSDSKYFGIGSTGKLFAWVNRGEAAPPAPRPPRAGPRVHVYAAINWKGVSPPVVLRHKAMHVTAGVYTSKVLPALVAFSRRSLGPRHIFQQDAATAHTAVQTVAWMNNCPSIGQLLAQDVWPPQSPDLSIIENFWSYIATKVQSHTPKSEKQLVQAIRCEFARVPTVFCRNLVSSIPARLAQVIDRAGAPTDY